MAHKTKFKNVDSCETETTAWMIDISFTIGKKDYSGKLWWNGLFECPFDYGFEANGEDPNLSREDMIELTKLTADE